MQSPKDSKNNHKPTTNGGHDGKTTKTTATGVSTQILRILLMDIPLLLSFATYLSLVGFEIFAKDYLIPQIQLMTWTPSRSSQELTYYHRRCTAADQSAHDPAELLVHYNMTVQERAHLMMKHGASLYPNLLSPETAHELRDFILEQNKKQEDMIWVIGNENRWSFYLRVNQHPSVSKALDEVLHQPLLTEALEKIMGPNPAVIEFTTITSAYGAQPQHWHQDVVPEGSGAKYARNFVPSYSLFIPLQNTTAGMGATGICPGTHMCSEVDFCDETGFLVSAGDHWPTGWGALVNQQTTHRGSPFTDPRAPHRVLFIITFAPRPRFGERQLETRYIGTGGSYSLHWSQWGATLRDFQQPTTRLREPFRTLRSLGIFKAPNSDWGWDFFTQASGRIANGDVGYSVNDFEEFVGAGGFPFLPEELQGAAGEHRDPWVDYCMGTLGRCKKAAYKFYLSVTGVYVLLVALWILLFRRGKMFASLASSLSLVLFLHAVVATTMWNCLSSAKGRSWAKNIRGRRQFSVPQGSTANPSLPASLPNTGDVLILSDMQSEYMATYTDVLDVVHPGNRYWLEETRSKSLGYHNLSNRLQAQLRSDLLNTIKKTGRRIMVKNQENDWAEADASLANWICHKLLYGEGHSHVGKAIQVLDHLLLETHFGFWRQTVLHREHIPDMLEKLEDAILGHSRYPSNSMRLQKPPSTLVKPPRRTAILSPILGTNQVLQNVSSSLDTVFLKENDIVEAALNCDISEWYRARLVWASSDSYTYDVRYEDGDEDVGLRKDCVRPFKPYQLGESVEVRVDPVTYAPAVVISVDARNELYSVKFDTDKVFEGVRTVEMRRVGNPIPLQVGTTVLAQYPGIADTWYPGIVDGKNRDGTYAILYEDGDYASRVRRRDIRLI